MKHRLWGGFMMKYSVVTIIYSTHSGLALYRTEQSTPNMPQFSQPAFRAQRVDQREPGSLIYTQVVGMYKFCIAC